MIEGKPRATVEHTLLLLAQVIPHKFGRQRPPIIHSHRIVEDKIRMCDVLSDIEVAQDLLEAKDEAEGALKVELQPHPADEKYASLKADLEIVQPQEEEYRIVEKYCQVRDSCSSGSRRLSVMQCTHHLPEVNITEPEIGNGGNDRFAKTVAEVVPAAGTSFQPLADETMTDTHDRSFLSQATQQASSLASNKGNAPKQSLH